MRFEVLVSFLFGLETFNVVEAVELETFEQIGPIYLVEELELNIAIR